MKKTKNKKPAKLWAHYKEDRILPMSVQQALMVHPSSRHLTNLSPRAKLILRLIYEDLKGHKFFDGLRTFGLDDDFYQPELGSLILDYAGLANKIKDPLSFYYMLIHPNSKRVKVDRHSIAKEAINVYLYLLAEKNKKK